MEILQKKVAATPGLLPGKSHGWRRLVGDCPWGCWESDMTEHFTFTFGSSQAEGVTVPALQHASNGAPHSVSLCCGDCTCPLQIPTQTSPLLWVVWGMQKGCDCPKNLFCLPFPGQEAWVHRGTWMSFVDVDGIMGPVLEVGWVTSGQLPSIPVLKGRKTCPSS